MEPKQKGDDRPEGTYPQWETYPPGYRPGNNLLIVERVNGNATVSRIVMPRSEALKLAKFIDAGSKPE
jgi:hypothetical protein